MNVLGDEISPKKNLYKESFNIFLIKKQMSRSVHLACPKPMYASDVWLITPPQRAAANGRAEGGLTMVGALLWPRGGAKNKRKKKRVSSHTYVVGKWRKEANLFPLFSLRRPTAQKQWLIMIVLSASISFSRRSTAHSAAAALTPNSLTASFDVSIKLKG